MVYVYLVTLPDVNIPRNTTKETTQADITSSDPGLCWRFGCIQVPYPTTMVTCWQPCHTPPHHTLHPSVLFRDQHPVMLQLWPLKNKTPLLLFIGHINKIRCVYCSRGPEVYWGTMYSRVTAVFLLPYYPHPLDIASPSVTSHLNHHCPSQHHLRNNLMAVNLMCLVCYKKAAV